MHEHILIVEDSQTQAAQLQQFLADNGYRVTRAFDGAEGLAAARKDRPDLVIADIMMPAMDGFQMCHAMKQEESLADVPIVVLTALLNPRDIVSGLQAGADYYLTKPCDDSYLLHRVRSALHAPPPGPSLAEAPLEVDYAGGNYTITSGRGQVLNLLLSTYENAVRQNEELIQTQRQLRTLNEQLEQRVRERTQQLQSLNQELEQRVEERTRQLRTSEANYRTLLEKNVDAMVLVDKQGKVHYVNPAAEALFGRKEDELLENPFNLLQLEGGTGDVEIKRADGRVSIVEVRMVELEWEGRSTYLASLRDITDKRRMQGELMRVQQLEWLGGLAGGIAHDFNNLLTGIQVNLGMAKTYIDPDSEAFDRLTVAHSVCLQASRLTQQLLTFSKGGAPIRRVGSIAWFLRDTLDFSLSGFNVAYRVPETAGIWAVDMDTSQMSQALSNVFINARDAMQGSGSLEVQVKNVTLGPDHGTPLPDGKYVLISVTDHGPGIPEEALPRALEPYSSAGDGAAGLGLAVTNSIVRQHGGYVDLHSQVGVGTQVDIYLPASEEALPAEPKEVDLDQLRGTGRILVMDDEAVIRDTAQKALLYLGYGVETARDGAEAVSLYHQAAESGNPFIAVILDLTVKGGMGGKEAIQILRELDPEVKAIVSSGYSSDPVMANHQQYGFRGVVAKPYDIPELARALREVVGCAE